MTAPKKPDLAAAMAEHFVNGIVEVRGRWDESARAAGYTRVPSTRSESVLVAIDLVRARVADEQFSLLDTAMEESDGDWESVAAQLRPLFMDIASGKVRATATQMKALNELMLRGYGRIVERQQDMVPSAVVVLPMLSADGNATVCPKCLHELEEREDVADHISAMRRDVGQSEVK